MASAALATLVIYSPARKMPFFFDDRVTIVQNRYIQSPSLKESLKENPFRAVPNLTFALQVSLHSRSPALPPNRYDLTAAAMHITREHSEEHGRDQAFYTDPRTRESIPVSVDPQRRLFFPLPPSLPFHLANLLLHMINALLLLVILRSLAPDCRVLTGAAAFAFLVHPLATEPVNYATARFTLMSSCFSLAAVAAHIRYDQGVKGKVLAAGFFLLALFSKESAAVLPLMVFLMDTARGRARPWVLWGLLFSGIYAYLRIFHWWVVPEGTGGEVLPWYSYLLVQQRVLWTYLAKIVFPAHLNFDPHIVQNLAADAVFSVFNLILLSAGGGLLARAAWEQIKDHMSSKDSGVRSKDKSLPEKAGKKQCLLEKPSRLPRSNLAWPAAICLMTWISAAPTSSFVALSDFAKEDRAYSMLAIILPALVLGMNALINSRGKRPGKKQSAEQDRRRLQAARLCAIAVVVCFGLLCLTRNAAWKNELALTRDMLVKSPLKSRARYQYATALKWSGRYKESLFWYERALSIDPGNRDILLNIEALKRELEKVGKGSDLRP
jgi:hypothetical protein